MMRLLLDRVVGLLICLVLVSSENKKYFNLHLDGALHHYDTLHVNQISHTHSADSASRSHQITFVTLGLQFSMVLKWNSHILAKDFSVYSMDKEGNRQLHDVDQNAFLHGHLENEELTTMVTAHISDEGILSAVVVTPNDTYHIEPSQHYIKEPHPFHMVAYAKSHVKQRLNSTRFDFQVPPPVHTLSKYRQTDTGQPKDSRLRRQTVNMGNIAGSSCSITLVADFFAFEMFGSIQSTASQLVLLISSVDMMIFKPTEWILDVNSNTKSGLGHTINSVLIHSEPSADPMDYYRGDLDVSAGDILGLMQFGGWGDSCLAHLLTNRNFPSGLLGLANIASASAGQTGGICSAVFNDFSFSPSRPIIFNTGLSTYNNNGQQMVLAEMVRVVGHELGHNWGTHHDPDTTECRSNFLMNEFAQDGSEPSHMVFSNCSRRSIGAVLLSKAGCFRDPSPCGNYAVDEGEECDVGTTGDECCTSDCTLIEECSDMNSPCCENCALAVADTLICRAGAVISADCTGDTYCNGVDLTCPRASPSVSNGTRCVLGLCLLSNESSSTTECVPLCETMGLDNCICDDEEECMVCCSGAGRDCSPIDGEPLVDGSLCRGDEGICRSGVCTDRVQDITARVWTIIVNLDINAFKVFLDENIVLFTLLFSIPIWCLWSCLLHWFRDHPRTKKMEQSLDKTDIAKVFLARSHKPPAPVTQEQMSLLEHHEPVDEPEDDLPPPKYRDT